MTLCDPNDLNTNLLRANGFKPPNHLCVLFRFLADSSIPVALFKRLMDFDINNNRRHTPTASASTTPTRLVDHLRFSLQSFLSPS